MSITLTARTSTVPSCARADDLASQEISQSNCDYRGSRRECRLSSGIHRLRARHKR